MLEIATYDVETTRLEPGDKVVVYSDGFTEARDGSGRFFEEKRLIETVRANHSLSSFALHDALLSALQEFTGDAEQGDDITLVVVEYRPE
jgi:sigma-B regulation protein RsbU (phosphoserine phosphatase)